MSAARKPKPQTQPKLFLKLDPDAAPDSAIGQTIYDWVANRNLWTPEEADEKLASFAEYDDLDNFFLRTLTLMAESGLHWAKDERPHDKTLAVMVRHLVAYVRAAEHSRQKMDRVYVHEGVAYRPLTAAAELVQAPRQTVHNWIKNKTEFAGRPLQSYYFAPLDSYFVSEESIDRMANRFVKWPSGEPVEPVSIGETKDKSGYIGTTTAARVIGVSNRTLWLWAKEGKTSTGAPLDVVKSTASTERDRYYIREKDVYELKKQLPKSGLKRGRRPRGLTPG